MTSATSHRLRSARKSSGLRTRRAESEQGREVTEHHGRFAKPYCALWVIDPSEAHYHELASFITSALPRYRERKQRWGLDQGPIAAYIDAKSEGDWLEQRAAKLSVAVESLKAAFLASDEAGVSEHIVDQSNYRRLLPELEASCRTVLAEQCDEEAIDAICSGGKLGELNRRPFRYLLEKLAAHLGLNADKDSLTRFIRNRNSLLHTGRFRPGAPVDEWLFMVNMLDRFYLKLLGYSGPYINWTRPSHDRRDTLD